MFKRISRLTLLVGTAIGVLAFAQPALGYTELGTTGTVGAHSLIDTSSSPGAVCTYKAYPQYSDYKIKHLYVNAPKMKAVSGRGTETEKVAWDFKVQRRYVSFSNGPWQNRYTSPTFVAYTDSTHNASFSQEGVDVVPPAPEVDTAYQYRVIVKLIWYADIGNVLGTATERVDWYSAQVGLDTFVRHHHCFDYE